MAKVRTRKNKNSFTVYLDSIKTERMDEVRTVYQDIQERHSHTPIIIKYTPQCENEICKTFSSSPTCGECETHSKLKILNTLFRFEHTEVSGHPMTIVCYDVLSGDPTNRTASPTENRIMVPPSTPFIWYFISEAITNYMNEMQ